MEQSQSRRTPKYLSPSNIAKFYENRQEWYINYIAPVRIPRQPQTKPMAIGSAFDAYVKATLYKDFYDDGLDKYQLENLLTTQVEPQNLDVARIDGEVLFELYKKRGALASLRRELETAVDKPQFEFELEHTIDYESKSIPIFGKPDLCFTNRHGNTVIYDWKVNSFYSNSRVSPKPQYVRAFTSNGVKNHKDAITLTHEGIVVNKATCFSKIDRSWATQLATYAWLAGEDVGSRFVVGIDQLCGNAGDLVVAQHRSHISPNFQVGVMHKYLEVWKAIQTGWYFPELTREESDAKCKSLDDTALKIYGFIESDSPLAHFQQNFLQGT
jgi:hypothetical protein